MYAEISIPGLKSCGFEVLCISYTVDIISHLRIYESLYFIVLIFIHGSSYFDSCCQCPQQGRWIFFPNPAAVSKAV